MTYFIKNKLTVVNLSLNIHSSLPAKMNLFQLLLAITLFTTVLSEPRRFDNYKVYKINVQSEDHLKILRTLEQDTTDEYDFWNSPIIGRNTDIMVPPEKTEDFEKMIKNFNMDFGVKVSNLQE